MAVIRRQISMIVCVIVLLWSWPTIAIHMLTISFHIFIQCPVLEDFKRCADSLRFSSTIVRTPGRNIWRLNDIKHCDNPKSIAAADHLEKNGYTIMGWDLEWHFTNELKAVQSSEKLAMQVDSMFTHNRTRTSLLIIAPEPKTTWFCWHTTRCIVMQRIRPHFASL